MGSPKLLILNGAEEGRTPDLRIANVTVWSASFSQTYTFINICYESQPPS